MPEVLVSIPNGSTIEFHPQQVFIRPTTVLERMRKASPEYRQDLLYTILNPEGQVLVIVVGEARQAFAVAQNRGFYPMWVQ